MHQAVCLLMCSAALTVGVTSVHAQSVAMTGGMGSKALLVIDGGPPRALGAGETHQGVKVVSVAPDRVVVDVQGRRDTVMLGGAPVSIGGGGGGAGGDQIVLSAVSGGHFMTQGAINNQAVSFMVDTGATSVALGIDLARRLGVAVEKGQPVHVSTANGHVVAYRVNLNAVKVQDVVVYNVDGLVVRQPMPYVLLGNSFLSRFQMRRDNDVMTLTRRY